MFPLRDFLNTPLDVAPQSSEFPPGLRLRNFDWGAGWGGAAQFTGVAMEKGRISSQLFRLNVRFSRGVLKHFTLFILRIEMFM